MTSVQIEKLKQTFQTIQKEIGKAIIGQEEVVEQVLVALLCGSNALLESYPGLGKTLLIKSLADVLELDFRRIQCTPDLMPSDIIGTDILDDSSGKRVFAFQKGPVFTNILLADEINRATPKTQSALLEAMQEKQVTAGGKTFKLDMPFFVLATQNPIEQEGSLALDQPVFINGQLKTGEELLLNSASYPLVAEQKNMRLYSIPDAWTYTLDTEGKFQKTPCLLYTLPVDDDVVTITLKTGRKIKVTKNHPFLVNTNGILSWKKAEELTCADYMVTPKKLPALESKTELCSHEEALIKLQEKFSSFTLVRKKELTTILQKSNWPRKELNALRIASGYGKKELGQQLGISKDRIIRFFSGKIKIAPDIEEKLVTFFIARKESIIVQDYVEAFAITPLKEVSSSPAVAFWLGCLLSDGTINTNSIAFYQKNYPEMLDRFETITTEVFGVPYKKREYNNAVEVKIDSKAFVEYLRIRYGVEKRIPSWFLSFPEDMRRQFLYSFIGLETYMKEKMVFTQKDKSNLNIISYMLLMEGIQHRIIHGDISRIKMYGKNAQHYLDTVGFPKEGIFVSSHSNHNVIPLNKVLVEKTVQNMQNLSSKTWYQSYRSLRTGRNHMTAFFAAEFLKDAKKELPLLVDGTIQLTEEVQYMEQMIDSDVCYEQIKSIDFERYNDLVFGLTVPRLQNYVAGVGACGINHNTYPLPEAQTDRFLLKVLVSYPKEDDELKIVNQYTKGESEALRKILGKNSLLALQRFTKQVPIANDLTKYVVQLIAATRLEKEFIEFGASPRASIGLVLAAKARALMQGRAHVSEEDIRFMAYPVLRHRIILNFEAERKGLTTDKVIEHLLKKVKI